MGERRMGSEFAPYDPGNAEDCCGSHPVDAVTISSSRDLHGDHFARDSASKESAGERLTGRSEDDSARRARGKSFRGMAEEQYSAVSPLLAPRRHATTIPRRSGLPRTGSFDDLRARTRQVDFKSQFLGNSGSKMECGSPLSSPECPRRGVEDTCLRLGEMPRTGVLRQSAPEAAG